MPMIVLNTDSIPTVRGGLVAAMLDKALARMAQDLEAAPDIAEWRCVQLEIAAKPKMEQGELADVDIEFRVKGKVPQRITSARMAVRRDAHGSQRLMFAEDSEDEPRQTTLNDVSQGAMEG